MERNSRIPSLPGDSLEPLTRPPAQVRLMNYEPPKFAMEQPVQSDSVYESLMNGLGKIVGAFGMIPCCIVCPNPYISVDQGTIGLVTRFGKFYKTVDPGLVDINPLAEKLQKVDVRLQIHNIDSMAIVTKDNVSIYIEGVLYWHVIDPYLATYGICDVEAALVERTQTTLRAVLGTRVLQDIIENRETIADDIRDMIDAPAKAWGVTVESILIKDIKFSEELQTSLSSAATQKRIGQSKVIAAQAEVDAAKLMREAAEILNTPAAMQIRYLETMQQMSKGVNNKVIFVPMSHPDNSWDGGLRGPSHPQFTVEGSTKGHKQPLTKTPSGIPDSVRDAVISERLMEM